MTEYIDAVIAVAAISVRNAVGNIGCGIHACRPGRMYHRFGDLEPGTPGQPVNLASFGWFDSSHAAAQ